jgi:L-threonylcarbamoyladenylate synthase
VPEALADYALDGGPARVGIESTVLSLVGAATLMRPGVIPLPELEALIGPILVAGMPAEGAHASPGMHERHYQPRTPLVLLRAGESSAAGRGVKPEMPSDPRAYAAALYETLHRLDAEGWDWIALDEPPATAEWAGVLDRLRRAASRKSSGAGPWPAE